MFIKTKYTWVYEVHEYIYKSSSKNYIMPWCRQFSKNAFSLKSYHNFLTYKSYGKFPMSLINRIIDNKNEWEEQLFERIVAVTTLQPAGREKFSIPEFSSIKIKFKKCYWIQSINGNIELRGNGNVLNSLFTIFATWAV